MALSVRQETGRTERLTGRDGLIAAAVALLASGIWLWFALRTRISLEDAYITFRYARNIAQGSGFVYNIGERVLGTTSPLQALLLAGLGRVFGPDRIPLLASLLMPPLGIAAGALTFLAARRLGALRLGAAAGLLLFFLHPLVMRTSLGGMETPLVLFLMALSLYFLAGRHPVAATVTVAALALCRIDGLIWGGLVLSLILMSSYRSPLRQAVGFGAVVLPWMLFAHLYFGTVLPNSMLAKAVVRPGREALLLDPVHFSRLSHFFLSGAVLSAKGWPLVASLLLLGLGVFAVVKTRRRELLLLPAFLVSYPVLMYAGRSPMFQWYLAPMLLPSMFLAGIGAGLALSWSLASRRTRVTGVVALAILTGPVLPKIPAQARSMLKGVEHARRFQENEFGLRRAVGLWLNRNTPRDASAAMEAVGYQGYYSERRVVDMAGLVTPEVIEYNAASGSNAAVFKRITTEIRPDYIVLRSFEVDRNRHFKGGRLFETAADRDRFSRTYREARRFTAPHPELAPLLTHVTVYERLPNTPAEALPPP